MSLFQTFLVKKCDTINRIEWKIGFFKQMLISLQDFSTMISEDPFTEIATR